MKKFLLCLALTTSQVFAGSIVPNIRWNQILPNQTGAAAALGPRNNISGTVATITSESNDESTAHGSSYGGLVNFSQSNFAIEAFLSEFKNQSNHSNSADINGGFLLNKKISIGAGIEHIKTSDFEFNTFKLNGVMNIASDIFIGGGVDHQRSNTLFETDTSFFLGVGLILDKKTTAEAVLAFNPEDTETVSGVQFSEGQEVSLDLEVIHTISNIQIAANASIEKTNNSEADTEALTASIGLEGEIQIRSELALNIGLTYSKDSEENNNSNEEDDSTTGGIALGARFNFSKFQIIAGGVLLRSVSSGDSFNGKDESNSKIFNLIGTYFF